MNEWMNNPKFDGLDPLKKELILNAGKQVQGKSGNAMATVMMSLILNANKKGIRFSQEEISLILELLKEGKSEAEIQQIDNTIQMIRTMQKR